MAVSTELRNMVRDSMVGLKEKEVLSMTGISRATLQRMKAGEVVAAVQYIKLANALGVPAEPFIEARSHVAGGSTGVLAEELIVSGLEMSALPRSSIFEILSLYRQKMSESEHSTHESAA